MTPLWSILLLNSAFIFGVEIEENPTRVLMGEPVDIKALSNENLEVASWSFSCEDLCGGMILVGDPNVVLNSQVSYQSVGQKNITVNLQTTDNQKLTAETSVWVYVNPGEMYDFSVGSPVSQTTINNGIPITATYTNPYLTSIGWSFNTDDKVFVGNAADVESFMVEYSERGYKTVTAFAQDQSMYNYTDSLGIWVDCAANLLTIEELRYRSTSYDPWVTVIPPYVVPQNSFLQLPIAVQYTGGTAGTSCEERLWYPYNGFEYTLYTTTHPTNYTTAKEICEKLGSKLAVIPETTAKNYIQYLTKFKLGDGQKAWVKSVAGSTTNLINALQPDTSVQFWCNRETNLTSFDIAEIPTASFQELSVQGDMQIYLKEAGAIEATFTSPYLTSIFFGYLSSTIQIQSVPDLIDNLDIKQLDRAVENQTFRLQANFEQTDEFPIVQYEWSILKSETQEVIFSTTTQDEITNFELTDAGLYDIVLQIDNQFETVKIVEQVKVYKDLDGIDIVVQFPYNGDLEQWRSSLYGGKDYVLAGENIKVKVSFDKGVGTNLNYVLDGGPPVHVNKLEFMIPVPNERKQHTLTVTEEDSGLDMSIDFEFMALLRVGEHELTRHDIEFKAPVGYPTSIFTLNLDETPETCLLTVIPLGSSVDKVGMQGSGSICSYDPVFQAEGLIPTGTLTSQSTSIPVTFESSAIHTINSVMSNLVSYYETSMAVEALEQQCYRPFVELPTYSIDPKIPTVFPKDRMFIFESLIKLICDNKTNTKQWSIKQLDPEGNFVKTIPIPDGVKFNGVTEFDLPARSLDLGYYELCLTVTLTAPDLTTERCMNAIVTPGQIEARFMKERLQELVIGSDQPLLFDSWTHSVDTNIDPVAGQKAFTKFNWWCRKTDSQDFIEGPNRVQQCFDKDISGLNWNYGLMELDRVGDYLTTGQSYEFKVEVEKVEGREYYPETLLRSNATLTVVVIEGTVPQVDFSCEPPCPVLNGFDKLNEKAVGIVAKCSECSNGQLEKLEGSIVFVDGVSVKVPLDWMYKAPNAIILDAAKIIESYNFEDIGHIDVTSFVRTESGELVESTNKLIMNEVPEGGTCSLSPDPSTGIQYFALITPVKVSCSGWYDPDGVAVYEFYKIDYANGGKRINLGSTTTGVLFDTVSFSGPQYFGVVISDPYRGSVDTGVFANIQVEEYPNPELNITELLVDTTHEDPKKILSTITSILSQLKSASSDDLAGANIDGANNLPSIMGVSEVRHAVDSYIDEQIPEEFREAMKMAIESAKGDPESLMQILGTMLNGGLDHLVNGSSIFTDMDPAELANMVNGVMETANDEMAGLYTKMMHSVSEVPLETVESIGPVLEAVNGILENAYSVSLDPTIEILDPNDTSPLQGVFESISGRIYDLDRKHHLAIRSGSLDLKGTTATIEGDLRPAHSMDDIESSFTLTNGATIENDVPFTLRTGYMVVWDTSIATWTNNKQAVMEGLVISLFKPKIQSNFKLYPGLNLALWNSTHTQKGSRFKSFGGAMTAAIDVDHVQIEITAPSGLNLEEAMISRIPVEIKTCKVVLADNMGEISSTGGEMIGSQSKDKDGNLIATIELKKTTPLSSTGPYPDLVTYPLRIEKVVWEPFLDVSAGSSKTLTLTGPRAQLVLMPPGIPHMPYGTPAVSIKAATLVPKILMSSSELERDVYGGTVIVLTAESLITFEGIESQKVPEGTELWVDGPFMRFFPPNDSSWTLPQTVFEKTEMLFSKGNGKAQIDLQVGVIEPDSEDHDVTLIRSSQGKLIILRGGRLIRVGESTVEIRGCNIDWDKTDRPASRQPSGFMTQALINQEAQEMIRDVLTKSSDVLEKDSESLTMPQLMNISSKMLHLSATLVKSLQVSLDNPLEMDRSAALTYEQDNYNDLFVPLPTERGDIRYVEEYTEEEWAREAVKIRQQRIAANVAMEIKRTTHVISDSILDKLSMGAMRPVKENVEVEGGEISVSLGPPATVLTETKVCLDWTVVFPATLAALVPNLASQNLVEDTWISSILICFEDNPYAFSDNAPILVNSGSLEVVVQTAIERIRIRVSNASEDIHLTSKFLKEAQLPANYIDVPLILEEEAMKIHAITVIHYNRSLFLEFEKTTKMKEQDHMALFLSFNKIPGPMNDSYEFVKLIPPSERKTSWFIGSEVLQNRTGILYLAVGQFSAEFSNETDTVSFKDLEKFFWRSFTVGYSLRSISKGCYIFNDPTLLFRQSELRIGDVGGDVRVQCKSRHLSVFSTGIFVAPNTINFDFIFNNPHTFWNPYILIALLICFLLLFNFAIVGIMMDKNDTNKGQLLPLNDFRQNHHHIYVLAVATGFRREAGTNSKVSFVLVGASGNSGLRELAVDEDCQILKRGTTDYFLLSCKKSLGELIYLRIWHDASGEPDQGWYLSRVTVYDVKSSDTYKFLCKQWLAVDKEDGMVERLIPVANPDQASASSTLLHLQAVLDRHAWFSCVYPGGNKYRGKYFRVQRMAVLAAFIFISMLVSAVFFNNQPSYMPGHNDFFIGSFVIMPSDVVVGLIICAMVAPFCIFLGHFFRNIEAPRGEDHDDNIRTIVIRRKAKGCGGPYPRWVKVILWLAIVVVVIASMTLVAMYGTSFSEDKSKRWIVSFFTILIFSVLFVEPFWAICIIMVAYWLAKRHLDEEMGEFEALKDKSQYHVESDSDDDGNEKEIDHSSYVPPELTALDEARDDKLKDSKLWDIFREMANYFFYLAVILILSYGSRTSDAYRYKESLWHKFELSRFDKIVTPDQFWNWTRQSLAQSLRANWYNDPPIAFGMRNFLNDRVSRTMGWGVIRQIRSKKNEKCKMHSKVHHLFHHCQGYTHMYWEDDTPAYSVGWHTDNVSIADTQDEFVYKSGSQLDGLSYIGRLDTYSAGGYTIQLTGSVSEMIDRFTRLELSSWVDGSTRALFIEFSTYNGQLNQFAIFQCVIEIPPAGTYVPKAWVQPVTLLKYHQANALLLMIAELIFCLYAFIILVMQIRNIKRLGWKTYRSNFWSWIDVSIMVISFIAIAFYTARMILINQVVKEFAASNGNMYVKLDKERLFESLFLCCLSFVLFLASVKMIRILRFNQRVNTLSATLSHSAGSVLAFSVIFFITNTAFNSALYFTLFTKLQEYSNYVTVMETTFSALLGKFDFGEIVRVSTLAPIIFMVYQIVSAVILLNFFVMVLMAYYEVVHGDALKRGNDFEIVSHAIFKLNMMVRFLGDPHARMKRALENSKRDMSTSGAVELKGNMLAGRINQHYFNYKVNMSRVARRQLKDQDEDMLDNKMFTGQKQVTASN